jgi:hypothetical protein
MGKIVVRTKFNKTGKRTLTTPLREEYVCAPANRKYRQVYDRIEAEFKKKMHNPRHKYAKTIARFAASYLASKSSSAQETYSLVEYLTYSGIKASSGRIDMTKLKNIPGLTEIEEKAWKTCNREFDLLWRKRQADLDEASRQHDETKRQLWRETSDEIHREFHPENSDS